MISNTFKELDFDLGNDIEVLKDSIQEFCKREISPLAEDIDKKNDFPSHFCLLYTSPSPRDRG